MARPIKDTPVLTGKDAQRFTKAIENVKPVSKEKREEIMKSYELLKSIATFPMP
ncbi:MAG: hypothetical protein LBT83_05820 [Tannerella sp.]|jgi:hypothetical protein|nr:hypothetical protein [Tannerella sp.]